jgi:hypothetical protein
MQYYPDNTLSTFTTRLPNAIDLRGDWEVGLVEIQYPHNWYNVPSNVEGRTFTIRSSTANNPQGPLGEFDFVISAGYYSSIAKLLEMIQREANEALNVTGLQMRLDYNAITRKIFVQPSRWILMVPDPIQKLLGMTTDVLDSSNITAMEVIDLHPIDSLYVYCDVIEPRIVGDSQVPLMRIVPVEGSHAELVTRIYENVHYVRLQQKRFQTVEINIRDRTGNKVPFERGTLNVTLHFRQRKRISTL